MTAEKRIHNNFARRRPVGFARLPLFLGIILFATSLRQEWRIYWALLELIFLDALLVSLSAGDRRQRLIWAFSGVWAVGFGANLGVTLASRVEPR